MMRRTILALAGACVLAAGCDRPKAPAAPAQVSEIKVGGPFSLTDTAGRPVTEASLLGKPTAVFFGFTYCPDVCPTTLAELSQALEALGPRADKLNVFFVSVDPERDTPAQLKLYLSDFHPNIQGYTGTPAQVAAVAKAYRIYYRKVPLDGGAYTVDHSSAIYLFDRRGNFVEPIAYGQPPEIILAQLRSLLASG